MNGKSQLLARIDKARGAGGLLDTTVANVRTLLGGAPDDVTARAIDELIEAGEWAELNDRFYKTLAFGTGGLRGRTIGKVVTRAERGTAPNDFPPEFPCIGTNAMNSFNVARATRGLVAYLHEWRRRNHAGSTETRPPAAESRPTAPKLVIAHDTRFFSRDFAELAAKTAAENGCDAYLFDGPRSTPELSFAVRYLRADAGIVITASHNPPHDNGYKVYFNDGAQVVEPHAGGITAKVNAQDGATSLGSSEDVRDDTGAVRPAEVKSLGDEVDRAYMERLETLILDRALIARAKSLKIVFTPIHGTGGVIIKPMLQKLGFNFEVVPEQDRFDGAFSTVKSPNPENAEALQMAVALAQKNGADLVVATDPDCDRMGAAVRDAAGNLKLITGNQIGSLLAYYRASKLFELGVLNKANASRGVIIKTFVTTDLQRAIAEHFGLRCVETLTGFKYIGAKLGKYERGVPEALRGDYVSLPEDKTRALRLEHSSFYVFGGEESYGYSGADFVRDKDANGAVLMFCEVAAYAKSRGQTVDQLLDEIYSRFGYFEEKNGSLVFEGAAGAEKIARLVESYAIHPPKEMLGTAVERIINFATETVHDIEGDEIPKEKMSIFELADHTRIAVRPSGTEPKIKYYLFGQRRPNRKDFSAAELDTIKASVGERLTNLWAWIEQDAHERLR